MLGAIHILGLDFRQLYAYVSEALPPKTNMRRHKRHCVEHMAYQRDVDDFIGATHEVWYYRWKRTSKGTSAIV